jgi:hypothetical protein
VPVFALAMEITESADLFLLFVADFSTFAVLGRLIAHALQ